MIFVRDVKHSQAFYMLLGARIVNDVGHYSRLAFDNGNSLSLHVGEVVHGSTRLYFDLPAEATEARLRSAGFECVLPTCQQPWNWIETHFKDPDGHVAVIYQDTAENRRLR
jgi:catechol 2,3-dioxygenase-like lactoylglutathione lyase family enzyme